MITFIKSNKKETHTKKQLINSHLQNLSWRGFILQIRVLEYYFLEIDKLNNDMTNFICFGLLVRLK